MAGKRFSIVSGLFSTTLLGTLLCGSPLLAAEGRKGQPSAPGGTAAEAHRGPAAGTKAAARGTRPAQKSDRVGDLGGTSDLAAVHRKAIQAALRQPAQWEFSKEPLRQVIDYVKDFHKIEIQLDVKAMEEVGVASDQPITVNLKGVSLESALDLALRPLGLVWTIYDEVLLITTPDARDEHCMTVEVYDVADLAACRDEKDEPWDHYETLIHLVTSQIEPVSWDSVGGPASISGSTLGTAKVLVITHHAELHGKIEKLLARIREIGAQSKGQGKPPMRPRKKPAPKPDAGADARSPTAR